MWFLSPSSIASFQLFHNPHCSSASEESVSSRLSPTQSLSPTQLLALSGSSVQEASVDEKKSSDCDGHAGNVQPVNASVSVSIDSSFNASTNAVNNAVNNAVIDAVNNATTNTHTSKKKRDNPNNQQKKQAKKQPKKKSAPLERLAKRGTLKFREQMRQLVEERDADQAVDKATLFEDNVSALETNPFLSVADPNVQSTPRKNSLDVLSLSFVQQNQASET